MPRREGGGRTGQPGTNDGYPIRTAQRDATGLRRGAQPQYGYSISYEPYIEGQQLGVTPREKGITPLGFGRSSFQSGGVPFGSALDGMRAWDERTREGYAMPHIDSVYQNTGKVPRRFSMRIVGLRSNYI